MELNSSNRSANVVISSTTATSHGSDLSHSTISDLMGLGAFLHPTRVGAVCDVLRMHDAKRETFIYKLEFQQEFTRPTLPEPDDALQGKLNIATCKDRFVIGLPLYGSWEEVEVLIFPGFTSTARRRSNSDHAGNSNQGNVQKKDRTALYVRFPRELPMEAEDFEQALEALLELARDVLACSAVHIVIDTDAEEVPEIVHTLQYVGFLPVPLPTSVSGVVMLRYDLEA